MLKSLHRLEPHHLPVVAIPQTLHHLRNSIVHQIANSQMLHHHQRPRHQVLPHFLLSIGFVALLLQSFHQGFALP
jgi:hypothetical protein